MAKQEQNQADLNWVLATRAGDHKAFRLLVEKYQRPVYHLCYRLLGDPTAAEDAAQETFVRAFFKLDSFDEQRRFATWLLAIASHYCLDQLRRRREQRLPWDQEIPVTSQTDLYTSQPEQITIQHDEAARLTHLVQNLSPNYRDPVILKYWYGLSYEEIAARLHTKTTTIKTRLFRARRMLAQVCEQPV